MVRNARVLALIAKWKGVDKQVRHGEHLFAGEMTPSMVLDELIRAPRQPGIRVTIPEGLRLDQIADLLEARGLAAAADYVEAVCDRRFVARAGAATGANCAEGYLFPDTYELTPGATAAEIADLQLARFHEVAGPSFTETVADVDATQEDSRAPQLTHDGTQTRDGDDAELRNRILTLASIIEKETALARERGLVSGVFHNRLRRGMKLQTDPTVIYGIIASGQEWDGNITRKHLREPTPYNTYTIEALPPGPICSPGISAIRAAAQPEQTEYLYFVAKGDGSHAFSRSYAEHRRAVRDYQLN